MTIWLLLACSPTQHKLMDTVYLTEAAARAEADRRNHWLQDSDYHYEVVQFVQFGY